jgi:tripeptidyl-peptidase-2
MSYGESPNIANIGRFQELLVDLVRKNNVIVVSSAGNGGVNSIKIINVACTFHSWCTWRNRIVCNWSWSIRYISNDESRICSVRKGTRSTIFLVVSSSSVGYLVLYHFRYDGDVGVSVYAPGGAITSVPNWTLQPNQLMNGTSMSSPNCCGCISLLLSALIQDNYKYTPMRIQRAIENTSKSFGDSFERGIIQVIKSYEHLKKTAEFADEDIFYEVEFIRFINPGQRT